MPSMRWRADATRSGCYHRARDASPASAPGAQLVGEVKQYGNSFEARVSGKGSEQWQRFSSYLGDCLVV
jgi:hypothetical protein